MINPLVKRTIHKVSMVCGLLPKYEGAFTDIAQRCVDDELEYIQLYGMSDDVLSAKLGVRGDFARVLLSGVEEDYKTAMMKGGHACLVCDLAFPHTELLRRHQIFQQHLGLLKVERREGMESVKVEAKETVFDCVILEDEDKVTREDGGGAEEANNEENNETNNKANNETNNEAQEGEEAAKTDFSAVVKCPTCFTEFPTDELVIHIGEIHMEKDLADQLIEIFPDSLEGSICDKCGEVFDESEYEYEKKEHILLKHPWVGLTELISKSNNSAELPVREDDDVVEIVIDHKENYNQDGFFCPFCKTSFESADIIEEHVNSQHEGGFDGKSEVTLNAAEDCTEDEEKEEEEEEDTNQRMEEDQNMEDDVVAREESEKAGETVPRVAGPSWGAGDAQWLKASVTMNTAEEISKRFGQTISVDCFE